MFVCLFVMFHGMFHDVVVLVRLRLFHDMFLRIDIFTICLGVSRKSPGAVCLWSEAHQLNLHFEEDAPIFGRGGKMVERKR